MLKLEQYIADWPDFEFPNFRAWMDHSVGTWPERTALRYRAGKVTAFDEWSYARLGDEALRVASCLLSYGLAKGDRVGIWAENRPEWCAAWLGAVIAGLVAVPLDFGVGEADVAAILAACEPAALFVSSRRTGSLGRFLSDCPSLRACLVFPEGCAPYAQAADPAPAADARVRPYLAETGGRKIEGLPPADSIRKDDPASIIFTSGTTGLAKGVMLSHHGIIANMNASILSLPIWKEDVFMDILPLHHSYPTTCCFISPLSVGASVTICESVVGKVILADTKDSGGTVIIGVPLIYDKLREGLQKNLKGQKPLLRGLIGFLFSLSRLGNRIGAPWAGRLLLKGLRAKAGLGTVRLMVAGGGPLNPRTGDFFNELGLTCVQGYGMSENGPLITTNAMKYKNSASAGLRVKYTDIKILDPDEDGVGEIAVRSPSLMLGYYRNPEGTKETFTPDGWLKTGDLGRFDSQGFLFITGRSKTLIVSAGGKNIFPEEIEAKFDGSRVVGEILVVGKKRAEGDNAEDVVAVCHPNFEAIREDHPGKEGNSAFVRALVEEEIRQVNKELPPYKKISGLVIREEEFEKTSSKKIKRYLYSKEYGKA